MALSTGIFNTTINPAELNMRSFAATMLRLFPNGSAPITGLSAMIGKSKAKSSTHGYFNKTMTFNNVTLAVGVLIGDNTIVVPSTVGMTVGMVFFNTRTMENVRVTGINSSTQISVTRAFGRVAAAAMNIADKLIQVGTAYEEGSNRPTARRLTTVYVANYTQIFRNAWALTDTARASYAEQGYSNIAEDRKDCALFHSVDMESALIWGQPKMDTTGSTPVHATQGIIDAVEQYAPSHTNTAAATTTYDQWVALVEPAYEFNSDIGNAKSRLLVGGNQAIREITNIGRKSGQVQIMQKETSFGMNFTEFRFYKGVLNILEHPLLNGEGINDIAIILDMPSIKWAFMDDRDTKAEEYGTNGKLVESGHDGVGGSLTTEAAAEVINPYGCAVIYGITSGIA